MLRLATATSPAEPVRQSRQAPPKKAGASFGSLGDLQEALLRRGGKRGRGRERLLGRY